MIPDISIKEWGKFYTWQSYYQIEQDLLICRALVAIFNIEKLIKSYRTYIAFVVEKPPTQKQFLLNLEQKIDDAEFIGDTKFLLRPEISYNHYEAFEKVRTEIIEKL